MITKSKGWMSTTVVAEKLGVDDAAVRHFIRSGKLDADKAGPKNYIVSTEHLAKFRKSAHWRWYLRECMPRRKGGNSGKSPGSPENAVDGTVTIP